MARKSRQSPQTWSRQTDRRKLPLPERLGSVLAEIDQEFKRAMRREQELAKKMQQQGP